MASGWPRGRGASTLLHYGTRRPWMHCDEGAYA